VPAAGLGISPLVRDRRAAAWVGRLYQDAEACAAAADLVHVCLDEEPGITRRRQGRGFSYHDAQGRLVTDPATKARIAALAIPPAWSGVWICAHENGHIVATGEDERGRRQYLYHERWRALRDALNFHRLVIFGDALPTVRGYVETQLRRRTLDRDRVLAAALRIVDLSAVRIGNEVYAEENDSFGLTTLTRRHVQVHDGRIHLSFPAKSGKRADLVVEDRPAARVIAELAQRRHRRLFTVDGHAVDAAEVNALLERLTGEHVTAKDFRTWNATRAAFAHLEERLEADDAPEAVVLAAVDAAAEVLGDTRAVARAHYVHPGVLEAFADGTLRERRRVRGRREPLLAPVERRLLAFLEATLDQERDQAGLGFSSTLV